MFNGYTIMSNQRLMKRYRIQLSFPIAFSILVLAAISLSAAFYLGLISGKNLTPSTENQEISVSSEMSITKNEETDPLVFFNLEEPGPNHCDSYFR